MTQLSYDTGERADLQAPPPNFFVTIFVTIVNYILTIEVGDQGDDLGERSLPVGAANLIQ